MNNHPLISCIIIFYNVQRFLNEAIESVLNQTYDNWELILVNDDSADGSSENAGMYTHENPGKIFLISHENHQKKGMSCSRNLGIKHSKGEFVAFLEADDFWLPQKLEQQVNILNVQKEAMLVYGRTQMWYSWDKFTKDCKLDYFCELGVPPNSLIKPPFLLTHLLKNQNQTATISDALIRRKVFEAIGQFEDICLSKYDDQIFFSKVYLNEKIFVADACLTKAWQYSQKQGITTENIEDHANRIQFLNWVRNYLLEQKIRDTTVLQAFNNEWENYSTDNIKDIILSSFPDFNIKEVLFLGEGINNRTYRVNDEYIFRFPKHLKAEQSIKLELHLLEFLKDKLSLAIPSYKLIGNRHYLNKRYKKKWQTKMMQLIAATGAFGSTKNQTERINGDKAEMVFAAYKEIKGSFLYPEFVLNAATEIKQKLAVSIAGFLSSLHSIPLMEVRKLGIIEWKFGKRYYQNSFNNLVKYIYPQISYSQRQIFNDLFSELKNKSTFYVYTPALLHGDLNWDHFIFNDKEKDIAGVIDFGNVIIGDPACDFVGLWLQYGEDFVSSVIEYYGCTEPGKLIKKIKLLYCCDCVYYIYNG
ncbi:MAG TPA: glycosyltransferase, partial [Ignavibacteriaceae bacterium]|nr:glycosyltransferase [Ignavibacteriaceae bacterium]